MIKGLIRQRYGVFLVLLIGLLVQPAVAQRPEMNIFANWTPTNQLTSVVDDEREVKLEVYATGNVQFWALDISCLIGRGGELTFKDFEVSSRWDADHVVQGTADSSFNTFSGTTLGATITQVGFDTPPLGENGSDYTMLLFTVTFDVTNDLDRATSVAASCRTLSFLDRNGREIIRGRQTRTTDLEVLPGYELSGQISRQGSTNVEGISVTCTHANGTHDNGTHDNGTDDPVQTVYGPVQTDRFGNFTFDEDSDGGFLRDFGWYDCAYDGGAPLLDGQVYLNLQTPTYNFLPVQLYTGDSDTDGYIKVSSDMDDLNAITANYNTVQTAFENGDLNGDSRVNEADLALFAGNVGLNNNNVDLSHVLYGMATSLGTDVTQSNSDIYWGTPVSGGVTPLFARTRTINFWPQASPNGSEIAFVAFNSRFGTYDLQVADSFGRAFPVTGRGFTQNAFAPSWSPDGNRIAFICADSDLGNGPSYEFNAGDICIQNRSDRLSDTLFRLDVETEIFPPAWVEYEAGQYGIIYAEDDLLKFYDLVSGTKLVLNGGSALGDMPVVVNYYNANGTIDNILFYRSTDGDIQAVEMGTYVAGNADFLFGTTEEVVDDVNAVDYFDVSPTLNVMYYTFENQTAFKNVIFNDADPTDVPTVSSGWNLGPTHVVDGAIASPAIVPDTLDAWTPSDEGNNPTNYFAQRPTFDWIP